MFYFGYLQNPSNIMKNIFNSIFICSGNKVSLLAKIRNKYLFFEVLKNSQIFTSKVCHFQYNLRFLFSREMRTIRTWNEIRLQKLIKFRLSG